MWTKPGTVFGGAAQMQGQEESAVGECIEVELHYALGPERNSIKKWTTF